MSAAVLILIGWAVGVTFTRRPTWQRSVGGTPTLLVHNGHVIRRNVEREHLTGEQVMESVRAQGLAKVSEVKLGVLEPNGSITIVPRRSTRRKQR